LIDVVLREQEVNNKRIETNNIVKMHLFI